MPDVPDMSRGLALLVQVVLQLAASAGPASGGSCWSAVNGAGRCKEMVSVRVSREQCCGPADGPHSPDSPETLAYSEEDHDEGALFFWQVLGGGLRCDSCRSSCRGLGCPEGRRCLMRRGQPRCVCLKGCPPGTSDARLARLDGPVCATDGRTYSSTCTFQRRLCASPRADLALAYLGPCRSSCVGVRCRHGRSCLLDQNLSAHCVKCSRRCGSPSGTLQSQSKQDESDRLDRPVCGVDGVTYRSGCHLRAAACRAGRAIAIAYRGPCRKRAECGNIGCRPGQLCLTEPASGKPRCVSCLYKCPRPKELVRQRNRHLGREHEHHQPLALCATNNITYPSYCHIMKDACLTGLVIETLHAGACNQASDPSHSSSSSSNGGGGSAEGSKQSKSGKINKKARSQLEAKGKRANKHPLDPSTS